MKRSHQIRLTLVSSMAVSVMSGCYYDQDGDRTAVYDNVCLDRDGNLVDPNYCASEGEIAFGIGVTDLAPLYHWTELVNIPRESQERAVSMGVVAEVPVGAGSVVHGTVHSSSSRGSRGSVGVSGGGSFASRGSVGVSRGGFGHIGSGSAGG